MKFNTDFSQEEIDVLVESIKNEIEISYITDVYHGHLFEYVDNSNDDLYNAIEAWRLKHNLSSDFELAVDLLFLLSYDPNFSVANIDSDYQLPMCYMLSAQDERFRIDDNIRSQISDRINSSENIRFSVDYFDSLCDDLHNVVLRYPKEYSNLSFRNVYLDRSVKLRDILDYASTITDENDRKVIKLLLLNLFDTHEFNLPSIGVKSWINNLRLPEPLPQPWLDADSPSTSASPALPIVLSSPQAKKVWKLLQEKGYIDKNYQPSKELSNTKASYIAHWIAERLGFINTVWVTFGRLWNRNKDTMRADYNKAINQTSTTDLIDELKVLESML